MIDDPMKKRIWKRLTLSLLFVVAIAQCAFSQDAQRLKVGLVLGGGGAKGAAEVGVLKVIEEVGLPIDYIAGTSIGSIVGGLYALGYRSAELEKMFRSQEWLNLLADREQRHEGKVISEEDGVVYVLGFPVSRKNSKKEDPNFGAIRGDHIVELFDSITGMKDSVDFSTFPIPFRCVAVDMKNQQEVVLSSGYLSKCMRASMAIPGAFKPVEINGKMLVDGGMLNNLPVDVVKAMGADVVVAIDLTQNKHETRDFSLKEITGIGGILDWAVSRPDWKKYNENVKMVDVHINPNLAGYGATSFGKKSIDEMIRIGEQVGRKNRARLEALKKKVRGER